MTLHYTERVPCPVCKSDEAFSVRTNADIVKCLMCELVYLRTRPSVNELEIHYQKYASNPGSHMAIPKGIADLRSTALRRMDVMSDILAFVGPERRRFIDVGSGWGAFLLNARDQGFNVNGVEICSEMSDFATKTLGIFTWPKQVETFDIGDGTIQVITLLHSLEHLPNLSSALAYFHRVLEAGGYICGIVPNFESWASTNTREAWPWLDPEMHYQHFTPDTLTKTLWSFGFHTLKLYTTSGDYARNLLPTGAQLQKIEKENHGEEIHWVSQKI